MVIIQITSCTNVTYFNCRTSIMENYTKLNSKPVVEDPKGPCDIYVGSGSKVKVMISKALKILEVYFSSSV